MNKNELESIVKKYLTYEKFEVKDPTLPLKQYKDLLTFLQSTSQYFNDSDRVKIIVQILVGMGISIIGARILVAAIVDPDPTSKLTALTIGGIFLIGMGGLSILRALGQQWEVTIESDNIKLQPVKN